VFVHGGAPAENIVADKKVVHHADDHRDQRDTEEDPNLMIKLTEGDFMRRAERRLDQIIEGGIPGVDRNADFHQKPGDKDD
jgi:hypothetical protein